MKSIELIDELIVKAIDQHDESGNSAACVLESIKAAVLADFHDEAIDEMVKFNTTNVELKWKSAVKDAVNDIESFRKRQADIYADHEFLYHKGSREAAEEALKIIGLKTGVRP